MNENQNRQPEIMQNQESYTIQEVAKILQMSERAANHFCCHTDKFIVKRCGPKLLRINKASFNEWWNSQSE